MIKQDTIIRTIILFLALFNQIMLNTGHSILPIADEDIECIVTTAVTIVATVWAWWKNNSFTKNAIKADEVLKELNDADK